VTIEPGADGPAPGSGTNVAGPPGLADEAGGDYTLAPSSPLVDRGDPAAVQPGELDFAGSARGLDASGDCTAEPDIGAFEPGRATCLAPGGGGGGGGGGQGSGRDVTAPAFAGAVTVDNQDLPRGHAGGRARRPRHHFRYKLSEAATVTFAIERKTTGRKVGKRCVRATKKEPQAQELHALGEVRLVHRRGGRGRELDAVERAHQGQGFEAGAVSRPDRRARRGWQQVG